MSNGNIGSYGKTTPEKIKTYPTKMWKKKQNTHKWRKKTFISSFWFRNCRMAATHIIKINAYEWKTHLYLSIRQRARNEESEREKRRKKRTPAASSSRDNGSNSKPNLNRSTWLSFPYLGLDDFSSLNSFIFRSLICFVLFSFRLEDINMTIYTSTSTVTNFLYIGWKVIFLPFR